MGRNRSPLVEPLRGEYPQAERALYLWGWLWSVLHHLNGLVTLFVLKPVSVRDEMCPLQLADNGKSTEWGG
jgi:hypothetical protein